MSDPGQPDETVTSTPTPDAASGPALPPPIELPRTPRPKVPSGPVRTSDWPAQATEQVVKLVDQVRDKTTGPALRGIEYAVYGLVVFLLSLPIVIILLIVSVRVFEKLLLAAGLEDPVWIVYLTYGSLFLIAGRTLWRKRPLPTPSEGAP